MTHHRSTRLWSPLAVASIAVALIVSGCGSSGSSPKSTAITTTSVAEQSPTTAATASDSSDMAAATSTTVSKGHEVEITEIRDAISASDPDLWSHVNFNVTSWDAFNGYTIPVDDAMDATSLMKLCESVSEVVYGGGSINDSQVITIATGVSIDDLVGTPKVVRASKSGSCKAS